MEELIKTFYANRDPQRAIGMAAYMKDQFSFLGIPRPERSTLQKDFIKRARRQGKVEWQDVYRLWDLPEREFQYAALDYLVALKDKLQSADIYHLQTLIVLKSWWDTVDKLAASPVGSICLKHPEVVQNCLLPWADSDNIWLARTAILFQLKFKSKTDTDVLSSIIKPNSNSKEFFINKAIGWALREYSKTNREWVREFIDTHTLAPLSVREASKYL
jgi:3-methyladenine DNA glycosylase AlkD